MNIIDLVVTDLDNTLWDWVDIWYSGFRPMVDALVQASGLSRELLESEIRGVFQQHGTSEYAFVIENLPSLQRLYPGGSLLDTFADAVDAHRQGQLPAMHLYPGVVDTLMELRRSGCRVVAYTESMEFYTVRRIRKLGLDGLIDALYSPKDHALPDDFVPYYEPEHYGLKKTVVRHTPAGELKPNSDILRSILRDIPGSDPACTAYVGDSLMKDITMAQDAGVVDVHAEYGLRAQSSEAYETLRRVTHWTKADVERERRIHSGGVVHPTFVLRDAFSELLQLFEFGAPEER